MKESRAEARQRVRVRQGVTGRQKDRLIVRLTDERLTVKKSKILSSFMFVSSPQSETELVETLKDQESSLES